MCPKLASMFDDAGGTLAQYRIDVRLVQNNVYFNKSIWGSYRQFLLLLTERSSPFNSENLAASTMHHMAISALRLG